MSLAISRVLKIHFQHRWTRHTICSSRITNTRKEYKRDVKIAKRLSRRPSSHSTVFRLHWLLCPLHALSFFSALSLTCYSDNTGFIWAAPVNWRYQMFSFSSAAPVCWPCRWQTKQTYTEPKWLKWTWSNRIFFCNASSNSSARILPQAWISLGSARMRNTDSHIFH